MNDDSLKCPVCGSELTKSKAGTDKEGFEYEKYRCATCGYTTTKYHAKPVRGGEFELGLQ